MDKVKTGVRFATTAPNGVYRGDEIRSVPGSELNVAGNRIERSEVVVSDGTADVYLLSAAVGKNDVLDVASFRALEEMAEPVADTVKSNRSEAPSFGAPVGEAKAIAGIPMPKGDAEALAANIIASETHDQLKARARDLGIKGFAVMKTETLRQRVLEAL